MKRILIALAIAIALGFAPVAAEEMTLDQVLEANYEALGGLKRLKSIKTATFKGNLVLGPGMEAPFTMSFKRPDKVRMEFVFQGMTGVQAYDGETAWMVMPFMGKPDAEAMPADQAKNIKEQADIEGPLVDWKKKGHQVELIGLEEIEGTEAYNVKVTLKNGDVRHHFIDAEHFVTIKQTGKTNVQGVETEVETTLSDYKEVQGLILAHAMESKPKGAPSGQTITITEVVLDGDVSDDLFAMPEPSAKAEDAGNTEG